MKTLKYSIYIKGFSCLLLSFIIIISIKTFGQDPAPLNNPINFPLSPTSASVTKNGTYPVNLQNGSIDIKIPLFEAKSKVLSVPISLDYNSSGIKVNEEASWVGLGWNLKAGGVITRNVIGSPDENGFINRTIRDASSYNVQNDPDWYELKSIFLANTNVDTQPDEYTINTPQFSGTFCFGNDGIPYSENLENLKIEPDFSNQKFTVRTSDGTIYYFGRSLSNEAVYEETQILQSSTTAYRPSSITSWYLTEIISPEKDDTIRFKYTGNVHGVTSYSKSIEYLFYDEKNSELGQSYTRNSYSTSQITVKYPSEIQFKNGKVIFNIANDRLDSPVQRLASLDIFEKKQSGYSLFRKIVFENNFYFDRPLGTLDYNITTNDIYKSLKLTGVSSYNSLNTKEESYKFLYNILNLPGRWTTAQDYWGYYNGKTSNTDLIPITSFENKNFGHADRNPSSTYMKACMLEKIIYPTGGSTVFQFEPHYYFPYAEPTVGSTIQVPDMITVSISATGDPSMPLQNFTKKPVDISSPFTPTTSGYYTIYYDFTPVYGYSLNDYPKIELISLSQPNSPAIFTKVHNRTNDHLEGTESVLLNANVTYQLKATICSYGSCDITTTTQFMFPYANASLSYPGTKSVTVTNLSQIEPFMAGGLRIKSVTNNNSDGTISDKKTYTYGNGQFGVSNVGTGSLLCWKPEVFHNTIVSMDVPEGTRKNFMVSSIPLVDFNNYTGPTVEYNKVTEYFGDEVNNVGKKVYNYKNTEFDLAWSGSEYLPFGWWIFPKYKQGELTSLSTYSKINGNYIEKQKDEFIYNTLLEKPIKALKVIHMIIDGSGDDPVHRELQYAPFNYYIKCGKRVLVQKISKEFFPNQGGEISSTTTYEYEPKYFLLSKSTAPSSNGDNLIQEYKYAHNRNEILNLGDTEKTELGKLEDDYRIGEIIEKNQFRNNQLVEASRVDYFTTNGFLKPKKSLIANQNVPYYDNILFNYYDIFGNLTENFDANKGIKYSTIWGINNCFPVVIGENIDYSTLNTAVSAALTSAGITNFSEISSPSLDDSQKLKLKNFNTSLLGNINLKNALISVFTYSPMLGMTSQTDAKGTTTYYEYDDFGRLKYTKDDDGRKLRFYQYKYQQ